MSETDIHALAESLLASHHDMADIAALRQAQHFNHIKDFDNCSAWLEVTDRVRELQNRRLVSRTG